MLRPSAALFIIAFAPLAQAATQLKGKYCFSYQENSFIFRDPIKGILGLVPRGSTDHSLRTASLEKVKQHDLLATCSWGIHYYFYWAIQMNYNIPPELFNRIEM